MASRYRSKRRRGALNRPLGVLTICLVAAWAAALAVGPQQALAADQARARDRHGLPLPPALLHELELPVPRVGPGRRPEQPGRPATCRPANGWQEFYAYWKRTMTDPKQMGPLGEDMTPHDHDFQSGDLFVGPGTPRRTSRTWPRSRSPARRVPGERTLFAAHPDSTPGLNQHNGSAYDDTSGITMGMAELQGDDPVVRRQRHLADAHRQDRHVRRRGEGLYGSAYYADQPDPARAAGQERAGRQHGPERDRVPGLPLGTQHDTSNPTGTTGPVAHEHQRVAAQEAADERLLRSRWANDPANMPAIRALPLCRSTSRCSRRSRCSAPSTTTRSRSRTRSRTAPRCRPTRLPT